MPNFTILLNVSPSNVILFLHQMLLYCVSSSQNSIQPIYRTEVYVFFSEFNTCTHAYTFDIDIYVYVYLCILIFYIESTMYNVEWRGCHKWLENRWKTLMDVTENFWHPCSNSSSTFSVRTLRVCRGSVDFLDDP